ncbi:MAG: 50S ribosomal protein L11 methyltransferase [Deltaproteobacteria bacterium]|nr:50S ribosomal protein L11 methyltransferase [Deltaproteobacteria bacterium]
MSRAPTLETSIGAITLHEYRLPLGEKTWSFLHTGAVLTLADEQRYLRVEHDRLPYGVMLWPSSIALAHEVLARATSLAGQRVLELGAGTGVPGIVAASLGARVLQTDHNEVALHVCAMNAERNRVTGIERRLAEWETFASETRFDVLLGSDVLYATPMHARLREICERYLAPGGCVLFSDPLREQSLPMLEAMQADGWRVGFTKWTLTIEHGQRSIAVYELTRA